MNEDKNEYQRRYADEAALNLRREGFTVFPQDGGDLAVHWEGLPLCTVKAAGGITYRNGDVATTERAAAKDRVYSLTSQTAEYMRQMELAPFLEGAGLPEGFKQLADYNGTVLAGRATDRGTQFVTWDWDCNRRGLSHGHYYNHNYAGAKQDFAVRCGMVEEHRLFSDEQMAEIYRCVHETLDSRYPITDERRTLLKAMAEQIQWGVPGLEALMEQSNLKEMEAESSVSYQDMNQQF